MPGKSKKGEESRREYKYDIEYSGETHELFHHLIKITFHKSTAANDIASSYYYTCVLCGKALTGVCVRYLIIETFASHFMNHGTETLHERCVLSNFDGLTAITMRGHLRMINATKLMDHVPQLLGLSLDIAYTTIIENIIAEAEGELSVGTYKTLVGGRCVWVLNDGYYGELIDGVHKSTCRCIACGMYYDSFPSHQTVKTHLSKCLGIVIPRRTYRAKHKKT